MNLVIEGPDGGGKSTLAEAMSAATGMRVQRGEGPPREPGEIERRTLRYLEMDDVIFDRHPAVSQPIYGLLRGEHMSVALEACVNHFYRQRPVIIYCRSENASRHVVKEGEDPAHVETLTREYDRLVAMYDAWATRRAHLIYRIGDSVEDLVAAVRAARLGPVDPVEVKRTIVRRINELYRRPGGSGGELKALGHVLEAVVDQLVEVVNAQLRRHPTAGASP